MKVFILMAVVVAARCASLHYAPVAVAETGASSQFRSEDNLGNYNFGYNEDHTSGGTFRRETGDAHGNVAGSYGLRDADGRIRIVNYIANDDGFKADIQTNEPGVEPKDPADATINKAEPAVLLQAAVPLASVHEPVVAIPAAVEPVAAPLTYAFPAPAAIPVAKSVATAYTFPEPSPIPVAKTVSTVAVAESHPVAYTFPEPAAIPVAKSVAVAQPAPLTYAFPAPAAVPVAKSVAVAHPAPLNYAFPAPAATVAVAQPAPLTYAFPAPAAVPVAKSVAVAHPAPLNYAFPAPAVAVAQPAPLNYAFPAPAAIPVAKSVAVAQPAPLTYAFPAPAAVPVAKSSYSSQVVVNNAPLAYQAAPLHYGASPIHSAFRYASPYYRTLYSPAVSTFAGPVPYFNNIEYHGYPVVKK